MSGSDCEEYHKCLETMERVPRDTEDYTSMNFCPNKKLFGEFCWDRNRQALATFRLLTSKCALSDASFISLLLQVPLWLKYTYKRKIFEWLQMTYVWANQTVWGRLRILPTHTVELLQHSGYVAYIIWQEHDGLFTLNLNFKLVTIT